MAHELENETKGELGGGIHSNKGYEVLIAVVDIDVTVHQSFLTQSLTVTFGEKYTSRYDSPLTKYTGKQLDEA